MQACIYCAVLVGVAQRVSPQAHTGGGEAHGMRIAVKQLNAKLVFQRCNSFTHCGLGYMTFVGGFGKI